jgi:hypothetical protein
MIFMTCLKRDVQRGERMGNGHCRLTVICMFNDFIDEQVKIARWTTDTLLVDIVDNESSQCEMIVYQLSISTVNNADTLIYCKSSNNVLKTKNIDSCECRQRHIQLESNAIDKLFSFETTHRNDRWRPTSLSWTWQEQQSSCRMIDSSHVLFVFLCILDMNSYKLHEENIKHYCSRSTNYSIRLSIRRNYNSIVDDHLSRLCQLSRAIGNELSTMIDRVTCLFYVQTTFLYFAAHDSTLDNDQQMIVVVSIASTNNNRMSLVFHCLSILVEGIPAFNWTFVSSTHRHLSYKACPKRSNSMFIDCSTNSKATHLVIPNGFNNEYIFSLFYMRMTSNAIW